jgi:hypothetical protein
MALKKKYLQATLTVPKYLTPEQRVALGVEVVNYIPFEPMWATRRILHDHAG